MRNYITKHRESLVGGLFVYPGLIYILAMIGYPVVYNFIISFQHIDVMTFKNATHEWVGFANYINLWNNGILPQVMKQTFVFTFWCIVFQFTLGLLLAVFLNNKFFGAKQVRGLLLIIWVVPMTVSALIWKFMFQTNGGLVNAILTTLGLSPVEWLISGKMAMFCVIFTNCWVGIPFNMILLTAGLKGISEDVYESAAIDGANTLQKFFMITLPLLRPAIMSVLILGIIYTFKVFDLVYIMTSGGPLNATELLSTYAYQLSFKEYQFSNGAAAANVLFLCLMVVAFIYLGLIRKDEVM